MVAGLDLREGLGLRISRIKEEEGTPDKENIVRRERKTSTYLLVFQAQYSDS